MPFDDLLSLRKEIDAADAELLRAFEKRMSISRRIGETKKAQGKSVYDPSREEEKYKELEEKAGDESRVYIRSLYKTIFEVSREHQNKKMFGVLGRKLPHTYSPAIHSLIAPGYTYGIIEREPEELDKLFADRVYGGFNVTIPYKKEAYARCDVLDDGAAATGAVNTVVFKDDGKTYGYNTDIYGFEYMLRRAGIDPAGADCLILGHGGASVAIEFALKEMGAGSVRFCGRKDEINYSNVYDVCRDAELIVNCTPVGMYPEPDAAVIDLTGFPSCKAYADLIYNPSVTKLMMQAKTMGLKTAGGLPMLVAQAYKASLIFKGEEIVSDDELIESVIAELEKRMKNIALIGMPGCGKSALGKALAEATGKELIDLDVEYLKRYNEKPSQTIERDGEDAFRKNESAVAADILAGSGKIVSCGGGIVTREENLFAVKANSVVVYLERPLDVLESDDRPLTAAKGVEKLYGERKDLYESWADLTVTIGRKDSSAEFLKCALNELKKGGII